MKKLKEDDWLLAEAKVSVKQALGIPFFREYTFLILFFAEHWRPLTEEEKKTGSYPGSYISKAFDAMSSSTSQLPELIRDDKFISNNIKVSKAIYNKYQESDKIIVHYNRHNQHNFYIVDNDDPNLNLDLKNHLLD